MRPFRYWRDPICLVAVAAYALNRWWLAPHFGDALPFLTQYFGDCLLIPCALPLLLWLQRRTGLRTDDGPPTRGEIAGTLVLWSVLFEWVFPQGLGRGTADPLDVLAYAAGAMLASLVWLVRRTRRSGCGWSPIFPVPFGEGDRPSKHCIAGHDWIKLRASNHSEAP